MRNEHEKIQAIRDYLLNALPGHEVKNGSRTHVDRTLTVFHGTELISTIQIPTALLDDDRPSALELDRALRQHDVADLVLSAPVVYLRHHTLGLADA